MNDTLQTVASAAWWLALVVLVTLASLCLQAGALNTVMALIRRWTWLHTLIVSKAERAERRAWTEHAVWELRAYYRAEDYAPPLIAMHLARYWLQSIPFDILWSVSRTPVVANAAVRQDVLWEVAYLAVTMLGTQAAIRTTSTSEGWMDALRMGGVQLVIMMGGFATLRWWRVDRTLRGFVRLPWDATRAPFFGCWLISLLLVRAIQRRRLKAG